jgi:hypothetical protein
MMKRKLTKRAAGMSESAKRKRIARAERPALFEKIEAIRKKAEVLTAVPPYTEAEFELEVYSMVCDEGNRPNDVAVWLRRASSGLGKANSNAWFVIVKATSDFETKRASRTAAKLANAYRRKLSVSKFSQSLKLPDRRPAPTAVGMGKTAPHVPGTIID